MSSEAQTTHWAIRAQGVGKTYRLYDKPHHRLLQSLWRGRKSYYREFAALHNISFELERGQTLGIIGRNGAGKSTLLQIICGTLHPSAGNVQVRGRIAALLELGTGFNPEFTGRENIAINAAILGLSQREIAERLDDIIAFADIGTFIDQPVKTYSSGMYVRLAFAVVVHVNPDILIVDEALAVGDALFQAKCMTRMRRMLDDVASDLQVAQPERLVTVEAAAGVRLVADEERLTQAVMALGTNALRHTPVTAAVRLTAYAIGGEVVVEVSDDGPGIPPEEMARVWDRFARVSQGRAGGGTGLGLAIVAGIVTAHGGRYAALSPPQGGVTFRLVMPAGSQAEGP